MEDFAKSPFVAELQKRLEQHAQGKDSWLIDWFNSANYFGGWPTIATYSHRFFVLNLVGSFQDTEIPSSPG